MKTTLQKNHVKSLLLSRYQSERERERERGRETERERERDIYREC